MVSRAIKEEDGYTLGGSDCQRDLSLINQPRGSHASVDTVALTCAIIKVPYNRSTTKSIKLPFKKISISGLHTQ